MCCTALLTLLFLTSSSSTLSSAIVTRHVGMFSDKQVRARRFAARRSEIVVRYISERPAGAFGCAGVLAEIADISHT